MPKILKQYLIFYDIVVFLYIWFYSFIDYCMVNITIKSRRLIYGLLKLIIKNAKKVISCDANLIEDVFEFLNCR